MSGALLLTCEHARRTVPARWAAALADAPLHDHRAWDPGALPFARALARTLGRPLVIGSVTRLLVDLNRSPHNPRRFSRWSRRLPADERAAIDRTLHQPHFAAVQAGLDALCRRGRVVHVAVHSFDPALTPERADIDIGVLYDPRRPAERAIAARFAAALRHAGIRTRRNAPYRGRDDGLPTWLRHRRPDDRYAGFELELSQAWAVDPTARRRLLPVVAAALADALGA